MKEQKEIKELSEWLTNLIRANEFNKSPDLPDWAFNLSQVLVYTIDDGDDTYLSALTGNDEKIRRFLDLRFIEYVSARAWASDSCIWPQAISVKKFLEWQQNIPEIKERWNTLQDLIDEIKEYGKS